MDQLTQIAAQLGIDHTFVPLFFLVVVFYFLMRAIYLVPFQHLLHDRKVKTEGAKKEAADLSKRADETYSQYKARLKEVNEKARQALHEAEEAAKKEESRLLGEAANKSKLSLQNMQKELDAQKKATIDALSTEIAGIAGEIATKALGRPVGAR